MNIIEAASQLILGYKVRRKFWLKTGDDLYLKVVDSPKHVILMFFSPNCKEPLKPYCITIDDIIATDWEVIE